MAFQDRETLLVDNAQLVYKNFRGLQSQYNMEGNRNTGLLLDYDQAYEMMNNGWTGIRPFKDDVYAGIDNPRHVIKVRVKFKHRPPRCYLISSGSDGVPSKTLLGEGLIGIFDTTDSTNVDLVLVAYEYDVSGRQGKSAYLQSMFYTMYEDPLELRYAGIRTIGTSGDGPLPISAGSSAEPYHDIEGELA